MKKTQFIDAWEWYRKGIADYSDPISLTISHDREREIRERFYRQYNDFFPLLPIARTGKSWRGYLAASPAGYFQYINFMLNEQALKRSYFSPSEFLSAVIIDSNKLEDLGLFNAYLIRVLELESSGFFGECWSYPFKPKARTMPHNPLKTKRY